MLLGALDCWLMWLSWCWTHAHWLISCSHLIFQASWQQGYIYPDPEVHRVFPYLCHSRSLDEWPFWKLLLKPKLVRKIFEDVAMLDWRWWCAICHRLASGQFGNWALWNMEKNMLGITVEGTDASSPQPLPSLEDHLWCSWWVCNLCSSIFSWKTGWNKD